MKTYESYTPIVKVTKSHIRVERKKKQAIQETRIGPDGVTVNVVEPGHPSALGRLAAAMNNMPVFGMIPDGEMFFVDTEAGVQRWRGCVSKNQVEEAFARCNFELSQIKDIPKDAANLEDPYLPHFG